MNKNPVEVNGHVLVWMPEEVPGGTITAEFKRASDGPWRCNLCGERCELPLLASDHCEGWKGNHPAPWAAHEVLR